TRGVGPVNIAGQGQVTGDVPLMPRLSQFLALATAYRLNYHRFNVCALLETAHPLHPAQVEEIVRHLMLHHDALRLRVEPHESGWRQYIAKFDGMVPFKLVDLSGMEEAEQKSAIEEIAAQLQTSLNVTKGPIFRVALFHTGKQKPGRLLILVHHIAADIFSMRILLEDFVTAYQQLNQGKPIQLPPKTTSVKQRTERVIEFARSAALREEVGYWLNLPWTAVAPLPVDYPEGLRAVPRPQAVEASLSIEETQALLRGIARAGNIQVRDVLLTALMQVFSRISGSRTLLFAMHNHGRKPVFEDVDLSRTVGWLTVHPSVILRLPDTPSQKELVQAIAEQLRRMPNEGLGYELLCHLSGDAEIAERFRTLPRPNLVFDYLGQHSTSHTSALLRPAMESVGQDSSVPNLWKSDMQLMFMEILDYQLQIRWEYSETVYKRATIEQFIQDFLAALRALSNL
ncbi:MAG TPA: condensation domain-containing protein, partial [Ktedonobacteraceae bacterium]